MDPKVNLADKIKLLTGPYSPGIVGSLNDYKLSVVKVLGEFVWHKRDDTDDFFLVLRARLTIQLRDRDVELGEGELFVVPRGVELCPKAGEEAHVLLIEPMGTVNTGDAGGELTAGEVDIWVFARALPGLRLSPGRAAWTGVSRTAGGGARSGRTSTPEIRCAAMDVRRRINAGIARQLGRPGGLAGRFVGMALNRGNRSAVTAAVEALPLPPGAVVADLGFGGGVGLALLLKRVDGGGTVHGVEVSAEMLSRASRRFKDDISAGRLQVHRASMTDLPFGAASVDGIITTNTIYFVPDLQPAFGECAKALKPAGRAVIGITDPDMMAKLPFTPYGFRLRSVAEVVSALERAGLTLEAHRRLDRGPRLFHLLVAAPR